MTPPPQTYFSNHTHEAQKETPTYLLALKRKHKAGERTANEQPVYHVSFKYAQTLLYTSIIHVNTSSIYYLNTEFMINNLYKLYLMWADS